MISNEFAPTMFDPHAACRQAENHGAAVGGGHDSGLSDTGLVCISTTDPHAPEKPASMSFNSDMQRLKRMRFNVQAASTMLNAEATVDGFRPPDVLMVTLTYRPGRDFQPEHISQFLKAVRHWHNRRDIKMRYVWVAELQERGSLHYHVLLWVPRGTRLPKPDQRGWWPHGMTRIEKAQHAVGYICKYASKLSSKRLEGEHSYPTGARMYGKGGLTRRQRTDLAWCNLPGWLRLLVEPWHRCKRIVGGGFASRETHEFWPSPWRLASVGKAGSQRVITVVPAFDEGICLI